MSFEPTPHAVLKVPDPSEMMEMGAEAWRVAMGRREKIIANESLDPLRNGYEPPIWKLFDALVGASWCNQLEAAQVRKNLGFAKPVKALFILGGNRGGKSEYAAKRLMMTLATKPAAKAWSFHSTNTMAIEYHHPLFWKYMPQEWKREVRSQTAYISYKQKTGFSESKFVLDNASEWSGRNYSMELEAAVEGGEIDIAWPDELVPPDWVETLELRVATREGFILITFTPVMGYTPTVKMAQEGAQTVFASPAFLLPRDGGELDIPAALGFADEEDMRWNHKWGRWSVPEAIYQLALAGQLEPVGGKLEGVNGNLFRRDKDGRLFEMMPRVMKPINENYALCFIYSSDNPFGNPKSVVEKLRGKSTAFIKERFYGMATKTIANQFPKFSQKVHVVPPESVPKTGTNYMILDPASGRNFFMIWPRVTKEGVFIYREWPGNYEIPGHGVPGLWALPDGKKHDGKPGPAQSPFGFGLLRYKAEIARLERWQDAQTEPRENFTIADWDAAHGAEEVIEERFIDSRAASSPRIENDVPKTLQTDFEDINLEFSLTPGDSIVEGVTMINDALDYDESMPLSFFNKPKLFISSDCVNLIGALQMWTGMDGLKGASKDPIDCLRYLFLLGLSDVAGDWKAKKGGYY